MDTMPASRGRVECVWDPDPLGIDVAPTDRPMPWGKEHPSTVSVHETNSLPRHGELGSD